MEKGWTSLDPGRPPHLGPIPKILRFQPPCAIMWSCRGPRAASRVWFTQRLCRPPPEFIQPTARAFLWQKCGWWGMWPTRCRSISFSFLRISCRGGRGRPLAAARPHSSSAADSAQRDKVEAWEQTSVRRRRSRRSFAADSRCSDSNLTSENVLFLSSGARVRCTPEVRAARIASTDFPESRPRYVAASARVPPSPAPSQEVYFAVNADLVRSVPRNENPVVTPRQCGKIIFYEVLLTTENSSG